MRARFTKWWQVLLVGVLLLGASSSPSMDTHTAPTVGVGGGEAQPTLLERYHILKEVGGEVLPEYSNLIYRPRQFREAPYEGWDVLELKAISGSFRTYTRDDWLYLTLRRPATLAVLWYGSRPGAWLGGWREGPQVAGARSYTRRFSAGEVVLGAIGGLENNAYQVLFAEADGRATPAPSVPAGLEPPQANRPCPSWVHDRYLARGPDGQLYRSWHPQIDPVHWCTFGHEHGSDPSLVGDYQPVFEYVAAKVPQNETPHEGFKGYSLLDGEVNWYIGVHGGTADHRRICAPLHTVVVVAFTASGELLAELSYKGDFGPTRANSEDNPVVQPPQCESQRDLDEVTANEKKVRVANHSRYRNTGYETWRGGDHPGLGFDAQGAMVFDFLNPMTSCDGLSCAELVSTGESGEKRDLLFAEESRLVYRPELDPDGDGLFYTDPYGQALLDPDHPNAVRQFVKPGLDLRGPRHLFYTQDAWRMGYHENTTGAGTPNMELERGIGAVN